MYKISKLTKWRIKVPPFPLCLGKLKWSIWTLHWRSRFYCFFLIFHLFSPTKKKLNCQIFFFLNYNLLFFFHHYCYCELDLFYVWYGWIGWTEILIIHSLLKSHCQSVARISMEESTGNKMRHEPPPPYSFRFNEIT